MSDELLEMQKDTFKGILLVTWVASLAALWLALFISMYFRPVDVVLWLLISPLTGVTYWLSRRRFRLATWVWTCALIVLLVLFIPWRSIPQVGITPYAFSLIVLVSSLLISRQAMWILTGLTLVLTLVALLVSGHLDLTGLEAMLPPLALMGVTAALSWISSDQLVTALAWTRHAQLEANTQAEYLRQSRDELRKSLLIRDNLNTQLQEANTQITRRAVQLATVAEVSRRITALLDLERLLTEVVNLICDKFGYYYAGVFLIDEAASTLTLRAAGGERGPAVMQRGLCLALDDTSLNGRAASTGQVQCVNDVSMSRHFQRDALLRETVSELTIPLRIGERVIGTLDVQSQQVNAFSPDDVSVLVGLADQVTIAIQNARLYEQVRRFNQQLEQMVQERTAELERAYRQLERLDRNKSDFINIAAHELRTPLTVMQGYTAMMQADPNVASHPYLNNILKGVLTGTARLYEIVNSMLDVARIDSQVLDLHPTLLKVELLIQRVQHEFESALTERNLSLHLQDLEDLPVIKADPDLLYKVFYNVIMNAIKYTPDGGSITVTGRVVEPGESMACGVREVEIIIQDTGIGIDPEHHELIFEKFYQTGQVALHSSGKTKFKGGGPGLGLAIARGIIQAHQGRIWVESPGHDEEQCPGSTFHIVLPVEGVKERPKIRP